MTIVLCKAFDCPRCSCLNAFNKSPLYSLNLVQLLFQAATSRHHHKLRLRHQSTLRDERAGPALPPLGDSYGERCIGSQCPQSDQSKLGTTFVILEDLKSNEKKLKKKRIIIIFKLHWCVQLSYPNCKTRNDGPSQHNPCSEQLKAKQRLKLKRKSARRIQMKRLEALTKSQCI